MLFYHECNMKPSRVYRGEVDINDLLSLSENHLVKATDGKLTLVLKRGKVVSGDPEALQEKRKMTIAVYDLKKTLRIRGVEYTVVKTDTIKSTSVAEDLAEISGKYRHAIVVAFGKGCGKTIIEYRDGKMIGAEGDYMKLLEEDSAILDVYEVISEPEMSREAILKKYRLKEPSEEEIRSIIRSFISRSIIIPEGREVRSFRGEEAFLESILELECGYLKVEFEHRRSPTGYLLVENGRVVGAYRVADDEEHFSNRAYTMIMEDLKKNPTVRVFEVEREEFEKLRDTYPEVMLKDEDTYRDIGEGLREVIEAQVSSIEKVVGCRVRVSTEIGGSEVVYTLDVTVEYPGGILRRSDPELEARVKGEVEELARGAEEEISKRTGVKARVKPRLRFIVKGVI